MTAFDHFQARFMIGSGLDYFFINAEKGDTYPCGYRSNENLAPYWNLHDKELDRRRECYLCDWECFQYPSELFVSEINGAK